MEITDNTRTHILEIHNRRAVNGRGIYVLGCREVAPFIRWSDDRTKQSQVRPDKIVGLRLRRSPFYFPWIESSSWDAVDEESLKSRAIPFVSPRSVRKRNDATPEGRKERKGEDALIFMSRRRKMFHGSRGIGGGPFTSTMSRRVASFRPRDRLSFRVAARGKENTSSILAGSTCRHTAVETKCYCINPSVSLRDAFAFAVRIGRDA